MVDTEITDWLRDNANDLRRRTACVDTGRMVDAAREIEKLREWVRLQKLDIERLEVKARLCLWAGVGLVGVGMIVGLLVGRIL